MIKLCTTAAAAALALTPLTTTPANADHHSQARATTVTVSCFRGPWEEVIWDRPNAVFIDSLVALGYDFTEAHAIGERVCRDESTVDDEAAARAAMLRIIAQNPPRG